MRTRSKYISLIGALARREGCRIATGGSDNFVKHAEAADLPGHVLAAVAPLFESLRMLNRQSRGDGGRGLVAIDTAVFTRRAEQKGRRARDFGRPLSRVVN